MRPVVIPLVGLLLLTSCVDPYEPDFRSTLDILVVDGTVTNLAEPQIIRLNRSKADRVTGRFGVFPITKATVEVVVDEGQVIVAHETTDGRYQLPGDFKGQAGHGYQLRLRLSDGTQYASTVQVMPAVPPITTVRAQYNPASIAPNQLGGYTAGHDVYIDTQDPADQHNYYRWDWNDYEKQDWCRSCVQGVYAVNNVLPGVYTHFGQYFVSGNTPYEECFTPNPSDFGGYGQPSVPGGYWYYDYNCRSQCWEILHNYSLNLFDDQYSNGGPIVNRKVAQIPYYTHQPCLVEIRQSSLTADAYRYFKLFQEQTQNAGGLADAPPTALVGNVHNVADGRESVVGYFTASAVSSIPYWLDRRDTTIPPLGATDKDGNLVQGNVELFYALNRRLPYPEPAPPFTGPREVPKIVIDGGPSRPPTALCVFSDSRTPFKPAGWRD